MEFLPWITVSGGDVMKPLLYGVYASGLYVTQNIVQSLYYSESIAHASAPRLKEEGGNTDEAQVDYGDPSRKAKVPVGNTLTPLEPPSIDRALTEIDDRIGQAIEKATLARVLSGASSSASESFASLNLRTQTALGALKPAKTLAEQAMAEMFREMLLWVKFTGKPLQGYGRAEKLDVGKEYTIDPETIANDGLYISVELTPDVPTDRMAKINAATMAMTLGMSKERALEEIGITDPQKEMEASYKEKMLENLFQIQMQEEQARSQMALQMEQMQAQAQIQQQQQQAAMMQQAQMGQGMTPPGIPGAQGGQGFNPAMGGLPAQMMQPGATREGQTGLAQGGAETLMANAGGLM
jgi:hypothetical protein